ncbi:hypothetical protein HHI36_015258 [Cryptolaemus montrouzieri]|uniref:Cation/H+ exchanger transmembrane domain-containing protein n=1 Tax=Cryptolaemus montrouzieri TaxID=559131 RepID=A0ABD2N514_9CUCU
MYFAAVPIILYRMCLYANLHGIKQNFLQILVISGPGFVMNAIMVGVTISFFLAREWSIIASLIFGSACVSIYPRENIERLRQLGHQPQHIAILLEGEAIFGTLAAFVLYNVMPSGHFIFQLASYREVFYILRYFIGGVIVGFILGKINCFFFWNMSSSIPNTLLISTTIPLTAFYLCTDIISVSGLIAISICGLMMDSEGVVLDQSSKILLREYWQIISIVLDAVILTVIGYVMGWNLVWSSNYLDYVYMVLTYCATLFGRCLTYIFAAPLTSRVGYGMDFRGMIVAIWAGSPSLINICYTILPWNIDERTEQILPVLSFYVSGMIVISLFLNMLSMPRLLTFLKMDIILPYRQNQLALCVRHLNKVRRRALMSMKIESLMGETDWKTAGKVPTLANPYDLEPRNDELNEDFQYIGYCPDCNQEIHLPPSHTEYPKLKESASIRVLKTRETLQIEMFSKGLISKTSFKILSGITRRAYDHPKNQMQVDGLLKMFRIENCCKKFEKILSFTCRKHAFSTRPPNYYWRRLSYHMMRSTVFHIIVFGVLFHNMVLIVTETCINPKPYANEKIAFTFFDAVFLMFYSFEFLVKVAGLSTKNFWKDGVKNYFRSTINILNFILLITVIMSFLSETLCYINRNSQEFLYVNRPWFATLKSLRMLRLFEFCKYIRLLVKKCLEIHRNKRLLTAYDASWIDNNEEAVLISRLSSLLTKLKHQARVEANDPEIIFGNVPWIRNFPRTKEFLFKRAEISTFDCGEYIYQVGDKSKGIYIIITGKRLSICRTPK